MNLKYTENQRKAINFKEGNLQIIACAGSGKTDVITRRIANLVVGGVHTSAIVAFTFTKNAAEEMKFRIRKHLQELRPENPEIGEMYIGTIHSFCFELLQDYKPKYRGYDTLDEHTQVIFISTYNHIDRIGLRDLRYQKYKKLVSFCKNVDVVRGEMIDPKLLPEDFRNCYENYLALLDEERYLDYSGMIQEVVQLFEHDSDFAEKINTRLKHIIVDEYQDVNPLQEKLIRLLAGKDGNVCVVGDDDQCIYQWRGTTVENLLTFADRYENVESIEIITNFRSSKTIVDASKRFIETNTRRLPKDISSWKDGKIKSEPGDMYTVIFPDSKDELSFVLEKIKQLRGTKYTNNRGEEFALDYRDIAIFFRSVKFSADPYIKTFKEHGIPFIVKGGGKLFEQDEVILVVKSIAYIGNFSYGPGKTDLTSLKELYTSCFGSKGDLNNFIKKIDAIKSTTSLEDRISMQGFFHKILGFMGADQFEFSETQYYNLGMLSQAISDFEAIYKTIRLEQTKYFLGFIVGYANWSYEEGGSDDPTKINAIKIMTVHRAKGLQFPVVFIADVVKGLFPIIPRENAWLIPEKLFDKERYEGTIEDERRLFYVALTRSEKYLFITGSKGSQRRGTTNAPSRFFEEIPKNKALIELVPDPTKREQMDLSVTPLLKRFATSYSDLRYYDRCPYDYKLRFIYGFNPEVAIALGYGKSIHNILNIIHSEHRLNPPTDEEIDRIIEENFFLRFCTGELLERFREYAKRIIKNYVKAFSGEFNLILETEKSFEFALTEALLSGQIDLIKRLNEKGELEAIEIVDFKEHDNAELATDYRKQLKLYAVASIRALGLNPKIATVHHLDEGTRSEVDIGSSELQKTEKNIKSTVSEIMRRHFPKSPDNYKCKSCDWKYFCTKND